MLWLAAVVPFEFSQIALVLPEFYLNYAYLNKSILSFETLFSLILETQG